ncbi:MAG: polysaccharide deacetylase family protein [Lentisphaeria bacterium]
MTINGLRLTAVLFATVSLGGQAGGAESAPAAVPLPETAPVPTYAERLGWPRGARVVIFHVDDAGLSPDSNQGTREALENGVATSASIMFPCPWVGPCAEYLRQHPETDAGIHLTLTSEWRGYRWGPVAGKRAVPGLVDTEGCLWPNVAAVVAHATPDEVETEIRAQLDRCLTLGIKPTHLDSHMGTLFASPAFFQRYLKVGAEKHIPVLVPGGHLTYVAQSNPAQVEAAREMGRQAWAAGLPVIDDLHTGQGCARPEEKKAQVMAFLRTLKPGITQFIVHCTRVTPAFGRISGSGAMRQAELDAMLDPEVRRVIKEENIILTTWRELAQRRDKIKILGPPF